MLAFKWMVHSWDKDDLDVHMHTYTYVCLENILWWSRENYRVEIKSTECVWRQRVGQGEVIDGDPGFPSLLLPAVSLLFGVLYDGILGFLDSMVVKDSPANAEYKGSIPGSGRSPGGVNGNPLHYSCPKSHGQWSLVDYNSQGCKKTDETEHTHDGSPHEISCQRKSLLQKKIKVEKIFSSHTAVYWP